MGHMSLKGTTVNCIKVASHKKKNGRGEGEGVLGSPYTRQGCFKYHVDEGQEDLVLCDWRVLKSCQLFSKLP